MSKNKLQKPIPAQAVTHVSAWLGPLPSPASLEEYKHLDPNLPSKIIEMAMKDQAHRHASDLALFEADKRQYDLACQANTMADNSNRREYRDKAITKVFALSVIVAIVGSTAFLVIKTADWKAWLALGVELVAFATAAMKAKPQSPHAK